MSRCASCVDSPAPDLLSDSRRDLELSCWRKGPDPSLPRVPRQVRLDPSFFKVFFFNVLCSEREIRAGRRTHDSKKLLMHPVNTRYFVWAKAHTAHCSSQGWWHHPNPGCSLPLWGCIWVFLNRLSCPPSHKLCQGRVWGPRLPVGFLPRVSDLLYNHSWTHLHGPSAFQAFGATRFPDGKVSARNRTAFPQGSLLTEPSHRYGACQSLCVGRIPAEIWAFSPSVLSLLFC